MPNLKEGELPDGNSSWLGGMDASLEPSQIRQDQYYRGCNVLIPRSGGGIKNRGGLHHQQMVFEDKGQQEIYENNPIQGEGWFFVRGEIILLACVSGYVFQFRKSSEGVFNACIVNPSARMSRGARTVWFTQIPEGAILNDAINLPLHITRNASSRATGLTPGSMGVYVQRRFFYVDPERKYIQASDYNNPLSIANSSATNIHGFDVPQNEYSITAIGRQKHVLEYIEGGVLTFSTENDIYSVDVRGAREDWEVASTNRGKVGEALTSIGATSPFSFESYNTNLYFRTFDYGVCDLRRSQFQFTGEEDFVSQSIEIDYWLENDTEWMLGQCYTRRYKNRLYTTIAPELTDDGYIYWNGMVVFHPNADNRTDRDRHSRRFEGIVTGVRPWCITVTQRQAKITEMFIHSYDHDGKNRMYKYVDNADYDVKHTGERIEIESWIETRGYDYGHREEIKETVKRWYRIADLKRDTKVELYTRPENDGEWLHQYGIVHRITSCCRQGKDCFTPMAIKPQDRKRVNVSEEPDNPNNHPSAMGGSQFCAIFTGAVIEIPGALYLLRDQ